MTPIINPWIFYFIDLLNNIHYILMLVILFLLIVSVILAIDYMKGGVSDAYAFKQSKLLSIPLIICILLLLLIPSKSFMYKMIVAQNIVPNNMNITDEMIKENIDYIFDKLDGKDK